MTSVSFRKSWQIVNWRTVFADELCRLIESRYHRLHRPFQPQSGCRAGRRTLTKVDAAAEGADTFFPNLDKLPGWEVETVSEPVEENGLTFRFIEYINKNI